MSDSGRCAQCLNRAPKLRRCTGCLSVGYCSTKCQKHHWPQHQTTCKIASLTDTTKTGRNPLETKSQCARCNSKTQNLRPCTGCFEVWYCSRNCQRQHWPQHQITCKGESIAEKSKEAELCTQKPQVASKCARCNSGSPANFRLCIGCLEVGYCSQNCQRQHWPQHKNACKGETVSEKSKEEACAKPRTTGTSKCARCKSQTPNLRRCTGCLEVWYCSQNCQRQHWPQHRSTCKGETFPEKSNDNPNETPDPVSKCARCNSHSSNQRRCTGCLEVRYCSRNCQTQHWPEHKPVCRKTGSSDEAVKDSKEKQAMEKKCEFCGSERSLRRCTGCHVVWYCSSNCQRNHWPEHQTTCKKTASEDKAKTTETGAPNQESNAEPKNDGGEASGGQQRNSTSTSATDEDWSRIGKWVCENCGNRGDRKICDRCHQETHMLEANMPTVPGMPTLRVDMKDNLILLSNDLAGGPIHAPVQMDERKAQAARRSRDERRQAEIRREALRNQSGGIRVTPVLTWEEARSRARRLYPGKRIVDKFKDLDNDMLCVPDSQNVLSISRITGNYEHIVRVGRRLEDAEGKPTHVLFHNPDDPMPYFRYDELRPGYFFCLEHAHLHVFVDGTVGFRVDYPWDVHVMEP